MKIMLSVYNLQLFSFTVFFGGKDLRIPLKFAKIFSILGALDPSWGLLAPNPPFSGWYFLLIPTPESIHRHVYILIKIIQSFYCL